MNSTDAPDEGQGTSPDPAEQQSSGDDQQQQGSGGQGSKQAQKQLNKQGSGRSRANTQKGESRAQAIKKEGMQVARGAAKGGVKGAGEAAIKAEIKDFQKRGMKKLAERGVIWFFSSPPGWITLAALFIIIIIIMITSAGGANQAYKQNQENANAEQTLFLTKTGPATAKEGDELNYTITVTETATVSEIVITDHIPEGTEFVSASDKGKFDAATRTVTWKLTDAVPNPDKTYTAVNQPFQLKLKATKDNDHVINWAEATSVAAETDGSYVAPNDSSCNGKYTAAIKKNALKLNFGDPQCNFNKDELYKILKAQDPKNADVWFNKIIPCESGYNPNAYNGAAVDANGAWGMYQMGSSKPPGQDPSKPGKNGKFDRGDTVWTIQTSNAVSYGKNISSLGAYWACAR